MRKTKTKERLKNKGHNMTFYSLQFKGHNMTKLKYRKVEYRV